MKTRLVFTSASLIVMALAPVVAQTPEITSLDFLATQSGSGSAGSASYDLVFSFGSHFNDEPLSSSAYELSGNLDLGRDTVSSSSAATKWLDYSGGDQ